MCDVHVSFAELLVDKNKSFYLYFLGKSRQVESFVFFLLLMAFSTVAFAGNKDLPIKPYQSCEDDALFVVVTYWPA